MCVYSMMYTKKENDKFVYYYTKEQNVVWYSFLFLFLSCVLSALERAGAQHVYKSDGFKPLFFPLLLFQAQYLGFLNTLNLFCTFFPSSFFILEQTRSTLLRRERERERDGWCFYSSQQRWQNDDERFYDDQEEEEQEELVRRRLGGTKKEIESKENG